jgi:hypothetical protein
VTLVSLVLILALVGFVIWVILQLPMPTVFRNVILGIVTVILILWVLQAIGVHTGLPHLRLY